VGIAAFGGGVQHLFPQLGFGCQGALAVGHPGPPDCGTHPVLYFLSRRGGLQLLEDAGIWQPPINLLANQNDEAVTRMVEANTEHTTMSRKLSVGSAAWLCLLTFFAPVAGYSQYFDLTEQHEASEILGYEDSKMESLAEENVLEIPSMATLVTDGPPEVDVPLPGEDSLFEQQYYSTANAILTPFIPGAAVWRDSLGDGVARETVRLGLPFRASNRRTRVLGKAGPFAVDLYSLSAVGIYTELSGQRAEKLPDDGLLLGLRAQAGLMLQITDEAYFRVHATFFYLPQEGKGGFFFGNGSPSVAAFRYETQVGDWSLLLEDRFMVIQPLAELLDEIEVDEISVVGRRRFGRVQQSEFRNFSEEDVHFVNMVRGLASKWLTPNLKLELNAGHWDMWRSMDFDHIRQVDRLGAALYYDSPDIWFFPWASYDYYSLDQGRTTTGIASVGATLPFSRTLLGHVKAGWIHREFDSDGNSVDRPQWDVGLVHNITTRWSHSMYAGQDYVVTDFGDDMIIKYWRYSMRFGQRPGKWSIVGMVQQHERVADELGEWDNLTLGARFQAYFSPRTRLNLAGTWTTRNTDTYTTDISVLRASLSHDLSRAITADLTFQYSDFDSTLDQQDLAERLVMLSLTWRL
jgi:hypothetical protein